MDKIKIFPTTASIKDGMLVLPLLKQNLYRQQWIDYLPRMKKNKYQTNHLKRTDTSLENPEIMA